MAEASDKRLADLSASFRQSRKEMWIMLLTWGVFAAWVTFYCSQHGMHAEGKDVELVLGMPRWVVFGIGLPWLLANVFIAWFSMCFMRDTDLGAEPGAEAAKEVSS